MAMSNDLPVIRVLLLGDSSGDDMRPVRDALAAKQQADVRSAESVSAAVDLISQDGWHPDLLVACQRWSREYTRDEVVSLIRLLPIARIVCCYGPWCGSDGRSGSAWPLPCRVPVAEAAGRIAREREVVAGRRRSLPLTAARDETFAFDHCG